MTLAEVDLILTYTAQYMRPIFLTALGVIVLIRLIEIVRLIRSSGHTRRSLWRLRARVFRYEIGMALGTQVDPAHVAVFFEVKAT